MVVPIRPARLLAVAAEVLDEAAPRFVEGIGAPSAVTKGRNDFATELDLELERVIGAALRARTRIEVHGEEFGGPALDSGVAWVLDPIDGTFNYAAGSPMAGMLLALVVDGQPVAGLVWLPLLHLHYAAVAEGPLRCNGTELPALRSGALADAMIGFGAFNVDSPGTQERSLRSDHGTQERSLRSDHGTLSGARRFAILGELSRASARIRMNGATGVDLAFTAAGMLGGAVVFGHHPWDNAAGVALVRAAGGVVTDLAGEPWTISSSSVLAAAPGVHGELLELIEGVPG